MADKCPIHVNIGEKYYRIDKTKYQTKEGEKCSYRAVEVSKTPKTRAKATKEPTPKPKPTASITDKVNDSDNMVKPEQHEQNTPSYNEERTKLRVIVGGINDNKINSILDYKAISSILSKYKIRKNSTKPRIPMGKLIDMAAPNELDELDKTIERYQSLFGSKK